MAVVENAGVVDLSSHDSVRKDHHRVPVGMRWETENGEGNYREGDQTREAGEEGFKRDMTELEELLTKLNPMAKEFVPSSYTVAPAAIANGGGGSSFIGHNHLPLVSNGLVGPAAGFYPNGLGVYVNGGGNGAVSPMGSSDGSGSNGGSASSQGRRSRRSNGYGQGRRRINSRTSLAQKDDVIRRTVYVSDIDNQITEEQLARLFGCCGTVVDCRICGDPNSVLRFAFIEFEDEEGAREALGLAGTILGYYPLRVLPSKTAIAPVDRRFLPKSKDEREMCSRTIYCSNIDKKVTHADVKLFFEMVCGQVHRLRLLGDYNNSTHIAFVEFVHADSATAALHCSGSILGSLPIRVSPSKTPVRPHTPRRPVH